MNIDRTKELLDKFKTHGISRRGAENLQDIVDYQDCIMRATASEIRRFEKGLTTAERQNFFWVNAHTLGMDTFLDILKDTYIHRKTREIVEEAVDKADAELSDKYDKLHTEQVRLSQRALVFEECKKPIHKRIRSQKDQIQQLRLQLADAVDEVKFLKVRNNHLLQTHQTLLQKAQNYDRIKEALSCQI